MRDDWPHRVAVLAEEEGWAIPLGEAIHESLLSHGCEADLVSRRADWAASYDLILAFGPHTWPGSVLPTALRLESLSSANRPFLYWWYTESVLRPALPASWVKALARLHAKGNLRRIRSAELRRTPWIQAWDRAFLRRHFRLRNLGEIHELNRRGLLGGLAVTAASRASYFRRQGFEPIVLPVGYHSTLHGEDLNLERDIDVGFLGTLHSPRRVRLLKQIRSALESRGIQMVVHTSGLQGRERTKFLNRTKIILNLLQRRHDFAGFRFLFCAPNRALMISEPVLDEEPFVPGRHLVTAPIQRIADTIEHYLRHDEERIELVENAYRLVTEEFTMKQMVGRLLEHARKQVQEREGIRLSEEKTTS